MVFNRRRQTSKQAIIEFWEWWPSVRPRLTAGLDAGDGGEPVGEEIAAKVAAIHPNLDWELGKGLVARHAFTVSPAGNPDLFAVTARWRALAPPSDGTWEFHGSRQAIPDFAGLRLRFDEHDLHLSDTRFGITGSEHIVDVAVFHPAFAQLPEEPRQHIAFLCLDWALGEHAVELWVGEVTAPAAAPPEADTVDGLRGAVAELERAHEEPRWVILSGSSPQNQGMMALAQVPLRAARWPRFDTHVALALPFPDRGNGLPTDEALAALRAFEDSLSSVLGPDGDLLAHETGGAARTLHYYVDGESEAPARLSAAAGGWHQASVTTTLDPGLSAIRHLDASR